MRPSEDFDLATAPGGVSVNSSSIPVFSYDVFDTLITRVWLRPTDVLVHAGLVLRCKDLIRVTAFEWQRSRVAAEAVARARANGAEISIQDIYASLSAEMGWSEDVRDEAMRTELECERSASRAIESVAHRVRAQLIEGVKVLLISDFYAQREFVVGLLRQAAIHAEAERVLVSCDERATKKSGELFVVAMKRFGMSPMDWMHFGDNIQSDYQNARRVGVQALHFESSSATDAERLLGAPSELPEELLRSSVVAGSARRARLSRDLGALSARTIWTVATNVIGPLLTGYVLWVLLEARKRQIGRLYFLSRDGQILLGIARRLCATFELGIDLRYAYASRSAWRIPASASSSEALVDAVAGDLGVSVQAVLEQLMVGRSDARRILEESGFPECEWTKPLTEWAAVDRLKTALMDPRISRPMQVEADRRRERLLDYLAQEGFLDPVPWAIVDVGWRGRLQIALTQVMRDVGIDRPVTGFYMALRARPSTKDAGECLTFVSSVKDQAILNPSLIEAFCAADHGTVLAYAHDGQQVSPVLAEEKNLHANAWGLEVQQQGILQFVECFCDALHTVESPVDEWVDSLRSRSLQVLDRFTKEPQQAEAEAFGSFKHAADSGHMSFQQLAPSIDSREMALAFLLPRRLSARSHWSEASICRSFGPTASRALLALWRLRTGRASELLRAIRSGLTNSGGSRC